MDYKKIKETSELLGVSVSTLRRWDLSGHFKPTIVTVKGTRLYSLADINAYKNKTSPTKKSKIVYTRAYKNEDFNNLIKNNIDEPYVLINDSGKNLNPDSDNFQTLMNLINSKDIDEIIILNKSHLSVTHFNLIESICAKNNIKITDLNICSVDTDFLNRDLINDLTEYNNRFGDNRLSDLINLLKHEGLNG